MQSRSEKVNNFKRITLVMFFCSATTYCPGSAAPGSAGVPPASASHSGSAAVPPASATQSSLDRAQRFYAAGDAASALKFLNSAIRTNPSEATAYYLKANCLVKLGRLPEAITAYSLAERLSPKSKIAEYSRTARLRIDSLLSKAAAQEQGDDTTDAAKPDSLPPGTLQLIRKQAALARESAARTGAAEAENEVQKASFQAKSVQERAERTAALRGNSGNEPVALSPQEMEAARTQAAGAAEQLKELGNLKAAIKEQESKEKADEIQQQADNLEDQLVNDRPHQRSVIKLNPVGTNFYVRNYSSVQPLMVPLHAPEAKSLSGDSDTSLRSLEGTGRINNKTATGKIRSTAGLAGTHSVTSVRGKVLPK